MRNINCPILLWTTLPHCHFEDINVSKQRLLKKEKASWDLEMTRNARHQERLTSFRVSSVFSSVSKKLGKLREMRLEK